MTQYQFQPNALPSRIHDVFNVLEACRIRDAVVYGGCLRDAHFGREIRDFDLLVPYGTLLDRPQALYDRLSKFSKRIVPLHENGMKQHFLCQNDVLLDVYFFDSQDRRFNFNRAAERADVGLSSIAMEQRSGIVLVDQSFICDARNKTLTYKPEALSHEDNPYMEKLQKKYPDFKPRYLRYIQTGW